MNQYEVIIRTEPVQKRDWRREAIKTLAEAAFLAYFGYKFYKHIEVLGAKKGSKKS